MLASCAKSNSGNEVVSVLPETVLSDVDSVGYSVVELPDSVKANGESFFMANDSLLIVNKSSKTGNLVDVINLKDGTVKHSLFTVGEGPEEMIMGVFYYNGDVMTAVDYPRSRYATISRDDLAGKDITPSFITYPYSIGIVSAPIENGDSTILVNPGNYTNETFGVVQNQPVFFKTANNATEFEYDRGEFRTQNVSQKKSVVDKNGNIWLADVAKSVIDIYDNDLNLVKSIRVPSEVAGDAEIGIREINGSKMVSYKDKFPKAFGQGVASADKSVIYWPFIGKKLERNQDYSGIGTYIFKFDLDGNLIKTFYSPKYILFISEVDGEIYATATDDDDNSILIKLDTDEK